MSPLIQWKLFEFITLNFRVRIFEQETIYYIVSLCGLNVYHTSHTITV